jgi:methyl-accepting chemotaxis protein
MKMSLRISALIGALVVMVCVCVGAAAFIISSAVVREMGTKLLFESARYGAQRVSDAFIRGEDTLEEFAQRAAIRSLDFNTQKDTLTANIDRLGYLDFGIVDPDGNARYINETETANLADRPYIQKARTGHSSISSVILSRVTHSPVVMFAVPIYNNKGEVAEELIGRRSGTALNTFLGGLGYGNEGTAYIVDNTGTLVACKDMEKIIAKFNAMEPSARDGAYKNLFAAIRQMCERKTGTVEYSLADAKGKREDMLAGFAPVNGTTWTLVSTARKSELMANIERLLPLILLAVVVFGVLGVLIAVRLARSISRPVRAMLPELRKMAAGDLTAAFKAASKDELGELAVNLNQTVIGIRSLVATIKSRSTSLSSVGDELASTMDVTAKSIKEILDDITAIQERVGTQSVSVEHAGAAIASITSDISGLNDNIMRQSEETTTSSNAVERMLENIKTVAATLEKNAGGVATLKGASDAGRASFADVLRDIGEIGKESAGLLEINTVMENIAAETSLLSMNAAVEAAHAGVQGRGFAVVADEINKLAANSSQQSKTIADVLDKIQQSIEKVQSSTAAAQQRFEAIAGGVAVLTNQAGVIHNAMDEQSQGSMQVLSAIERLNALSDEVKEKSERMLAGSQRVVAESNSLEGVTTDISAGVQDMTTGADAIAQAVRKVNALSAENSGAITELAREVARFRL